MSNSSQSPSPTASQTIAQSFQQPLIQYLLLFLVVLCVLAPTFTYTFIWDDWHGIASNQAIRDWERIPDYFTDPNTFTQDPGNVYRDEWRPLRNVYFLLTYKTHGLHPAGWHFNHVLLQCMASVLILAFFHRLIRYKLNTNQQSHLPIHWQLGCWFAVCIWAIHPVNTEVTAWLKSADDILAVILSFSALIILFPIGTQLTYTRSVIAGLLFATAFLAKESIAPLPAIYVILAVALAPDPRRVLRHRPFWLATAMLFLALALYVYLRNLMLGKIEQVPYLAGSFSSMMATMVIAGVRYLQVIFWPFWPTQLIGDYQSWPVASGWNIPEVKYNLSILLVAFVIFIVIARRSLIISVGFIFAVLAFLPAANIIPMMQVMAERFLYFPLIGVSLAGAALIATILRPNPIRRLWIPVLLTVCFIVTTEVRLPAWETEASFQATNIEALPLSNRSWYNRASQLVLEGRTTPALAMLTVFRKDNPHHIDGGITSTMLLYEMGNETSATKMLEELVLEFPESPRPYALKADIARGKGDLRTAVECYEKSIAIAPARFPMLHYLAGITYKSLGEVTSATFHLETAIKLDSRLTSAQLVLKSIQNE